MIIGANQNSTISNDTKGTKKYKLSEIRSTTESDFMFPNMSSTKSLLRRENTTTPVALTTSKTRPTEYPKVRYADI